MINFINKRVILGLNTIINLNLLDERCPSIILSINGADCNYWYIQPNLSFFGTL